MSFFASLPVTRFQFLIGRLRTRKQITKSVMGREFQFLIGRLRTRGSGITA